MVLPVDPLLRSNEGESLTVTLPVLVDGLSAVQSDTSETRQPFVVILLLFLKKVVRPSHW